MKQKHYYLKKTKFEERCPGLHRCGIVVLLEEDGKIARGVSLCNDTEDPFLRDEGLLPAREKGTYTKFMGGMAMSERRAKKALLAGRSSEPIQRQEAIYKVDSTMFHKSEFMPMLTTYEKKLLAGGGGGGK